MRITGGVAGPDGAANAQQLFKKIDTDGDGKVTKEEFTAGAPKRGGGKGPSVDDLFSRIDTNGDGSIEEGENKTFLESVKSRRPGSHVDQRSTSYSADGSSRVPTGPTFSRVA